jgi:hypothetical protein
MCDRVSLGISERIRVVDHSFSFWKKAFGDTRPYS